MTHRILVSRRRAAELAGRTRESIKQLIKRGRLIEAEAFDGTTVRKGIPFESLADYYGWAPVIRDAILASHGVDPDSDGLHYLTTGDGK